MADLNIEIAASLGRFEREMAKVEARLTKMANGIEKKAASQLGRVDTSAAQTAANLNRMVGQMDKAEGSSRKFGGALQNVGFQVGDFATQVGAGTSATQALGQQLPQLLGTFGTFGALAGAAAAIMIPLGSALIKTAFDSETLEERMKALSASTDAMQEAAKAAATPIADLEVKYGDLADEIARANGAMAAFTAAQAGVQLKGAAGATAALFPDAKLPTRIYGMADNEWAAVQEAQMRKLMKATGASREEAEELAMALRRLESTNGPEAVVRDAENLLSVMERLPDSTTRLAPQFEAIKGLMKQAQAQIEAQRAEVVRLREEYGKTTTELQRLVADRSLAEAELAKAVKAGNAEQANAAQGYIDKIDEAIEKTKTLAVESDTAFQMIAGRLVSLAESFPDLSLQLPGGAPFAREMATAATEIEAANKGLRELIKLKESGGDYNATLDNGRWTGGQRDLVNMTLNEVRALQRQMIANPENRRKYGNGKGSSALGAYQIVGTTLDGLIRELGLSGNELYSREMQDRLADQLIRRRRGQGVTGLRNEWEGLQSVHPDVIQRAMGAQSTTLVDPEVQRREEQAASKRQQDLEREVKLRKDKAEAERQAAKALSESLVGQQKAAELERQRADAVAAINASGQSDEAKAAAIAQVNAEMQRQITIMALMEEAKRRQVDIDTLMVGSTMTYRQAIEALGETAKQKIISDQQMQASAQSLAEAQAFANQQMQTLQDGFLDAIIAGESFADVLKNVAAQMAKAWAQAALFGSGPLASQGGGGLFAGLFGNGGFLSQVFGGAGRGGSLFSYDGGGFTGSGPRMGGVDGKGGFPAILHPNETVIDHTRGQRMGGGTVTLVVDVRGANGNTEIQQMVAAGVSQGMDQVRREVPGIMQNYQKRNG